MNTEFSGAACHRCWHSTGGCQAEPGSPGLDSAVDRNWTQEFMDRNLDQDCRQEQQQDPLHKPAIDKQIPQL